MWPNQEYKLVIGNQTKTGFVEIRKLSADIRDNSRKYDGGSYDYTQSSFTHHKGRHHYAYFDKQTGKLIQYGEIEPDVCPEDSETRNARGLVRTAIQNATSNYGLAMVIVAAVAGLGGGFALAFALYPVLVPHATQQAVQVASMVIH